MSLFDTILPINGLNNVVSSVGDVARDALGIGKTKSNGTSKAQFSLDDFKGEVLGKGLAEENRFEVFIGIPPCLSGTGGTWGKHMQSSLIRIESVVFPPLQLYVKDRKTFGAAQPVPVSMDYGGESGITITFLLDRDMNTKKMFDAWMDSIVDSETQTVAYPDDYRTLIGIHQLDKLDGSVYEAIIRNAYPKIVSPLQATHTAHGTFHRLVVTFAYRKWTCKEVDAAALAADSAAASIASKGGDVVKSVSDQINQRATNLASIAQKYGLQTSISGISL